METATFANRKLRLAHRSIQRKKMHVRMSSVLLNTSILAIYGLWKSSEIVWMSSVLLNTSILAIYGLWKSSEIVLLTNRSQYVS
jgi:uncharacterized membrane protein